MIKSFFDTKICDMVKDDFWKGYSEKKIWTDRNMISDLFPDVPINATLADVLNALKEENINYNDINLIKTNMLLFWLSMMIVYSENDNIKKFCNKDINEYFSLLDEKVPVASGRAGYFDDIRRECLCFIDDCRQYEYGISDTNGEIITIKNTIGSVIEICYAILSDPAFYYNDNLYENNDYLIRGAEKCLKSIMYEPFFFVYEKL